MKRHHPYPGDNDGKLEARFYLYQEAAKRPRAGHAIALAGSQPAEELRLLRDYLRWPAQRVWFVDKDRSLATRQALSYIRREWPQAHVWNNSLRAVLPNLDSIGFAYLDFMGHLNASNCMPCLWETAKLMRPGGILGLTWERGRENGGTSSRRIFSEAKKGRTLQERRWEGVLKVVDQITTKRLRLISAYEYQNNHSPMSLNVYERV